ncbi:MAG: pentapeptide repeat-containing protein [candidate division Zixibacteria bacterium]|nr:pentapeptide repeat-containing protein [candidate division Zixibacteria bacterium]
MSTNQDKLCQIEVHNSQKCHRQIYIDEKGKTREACILHCKKDNPTEIGNFKEALSEYIKACKKGRQKFDFTRFRFPPSGWVFPKSFLNDLYLDGAIFEGGVDFHKLKMNIHNASFTKTIFEKDVDFSEADFSGKVDYLDAEFHGKVDFSNSHFRKDCIFGNTKFYGSAIFSKCHFFEKADFSYNKPSGIINLGSLNFKECQFDGDEYSSFEGRNLYKAYFEGANLSKLNFNLAMWNKKTFFILNIGRNRLYDETQKSWFVVTKLLIKALFYKDVFKKYWFIKMVLLPMAIIYLVFVPRRRACEKICQAYRQLQENYEGKYRYREAGDFFIGEQETYRKSLGPIWRIFCLQFLYKWISNYGESYFRPLVWILLIVFLMPSIFLFQGIYLNEHIEPPKSVVIYEWDGAYSLVESFEKDEYGDAFMVNFGFITFDRKQISEILPKRLTRFIVNIESITIIVLLSFFLLALKRRFKRKSF